MENHSVKLNILGRQFTIKANEQEQKALLQAEELIHERIKTLQSEYTVIDKLNVAIMCCIHVATEYIRHQDETEANVETALSRLLSIEKRLNVPIVAQEE